MDGMKFPEGLSTKAQMIWSMLDDMAENDPNAYSKFIERQIKEGKEHFALPEPHLCIEVLLHKKPRRPLFVNFCSWCKVPEPKSNLHPVPVTGTEILDVEKDEKNGFHSITSVAFNKKVLDELDQLDKADQNTLFNLALDYIEHEHKVKVTRKYKILPPETTHKGDFKLIQLSFTKNLRNQQKDSEKKNMDDSGNFGGSNSDDLPFDESLMSRLSNIVAGDSTPAGPYCENNGQSSIHVPGLTNSNGSTSSTKGGHSLIEEVKDEQPENRLVTPKHSLMQCEVENGHALVLKVDMPGVQSVAVCELDISEDDVKLLVPCRYELCIKLPSSIDEDRSSAKFSKKASQLIVTMPVKS